MQRILSLLVLILLSTGAMAAPVPPELQGVWRASGELPAPQGQHSMSWMLEYTFQADGTYKMTGYPPITESGRLEVTSEKAGHYTLKFTERIFMNEKSVDISYPAELDSDHKALKFHDKTFFLATP